MKNNKYKKIKKVIWAGASTGVMTSLILMGPSNAALAETIDNPTPTFSQEIKVSSPMHTMRHWDSPKKVGVLSTTFGLDPTEVTMELRSGKGMKQILQENGIPTEELGKTFVGRKSMGKRMWKHNLNKYQNNL